MSNRFKENAGPYAYVQYTPGEPIASNNPNEGSVKRRNAKKRIGQRRAFILVRVLSFKIVHIIRCLFLVIVRTNFR